MVELTRTPQLVTIDGIEVYGFLEANEDYSEENCPSYQRAEYIEDGWFIQQSSAGFEAIEIVQYGGGSHTHSVHTTFIDAYNACMNFG